MTTKSKLMKLFHNMSTKRGFLHPFHSIINIEFVAYFIPVIIYSYMCYDYYTKRYKINSDETTTYLEKNINTHTFLKDIHEYCDVSKDDCLLSHTITVSAYNEIKNRGIDAYLDKMKRNPKVFETDKEYVFIFQKNDIPEEQARGNLFAPYHVNPDVHEEYAAISEPKVQEKCGKGRCGLVQIVKQIVEVSDKYKNGGFVQYEWYDAKTQETIIKKSFVIKINDVEYKGQKTDLYIGSGHTVKQLAQEISFTQLNMCIINCFLFITLWIFFDFKYILKNNNFSFVILIFASLFLSCLMFDSYEIEYTHQEYYNRFAKIGSSAKTLAMFLGSTLVYLNLIKEKQHPALFKLLVFSLLFILFSSIYYSSKDLNLLSYIYQFKYISIVNASVSVFLTFILITLNRLT